MAEPELAEASFSTLGESGDHGIMSLESMETAVSLQFLEDTLISLYSWQRLPWYKRLFSRPRPLPLRDRVELVKLRALIGRTGLFDADYYLNNYPDVATSGIDPLSHFALYGCNECRKPSLLFDPEEYLRANPQLDKLSTNPLLHFISHHLHRGKNGPLIADISVDVGEPTINADSLVEILKRRQLSENNVLTKLAKVRLQSFLNKAGKDFFWSSSSKRIAKPLVSIIYVLYGKAELLIPTLESLISEYDAGIEVIVIDNGSSDDTHLLLRLLDGIRYVINDMNVGFIEAANQASQMALGKYLLFLNNDTILQLGSIRSALNTIQSDPKIGVVGGKIVLLNGTLQEAGCILFSDGSTLGFGRGADPLDPRFENQRDVLFISGCFFLTPKELFITNGGFNRRYQPAYYEDVDYCLRLWTLGYRTVYDPGVELFHYEHGSSNREKVAELMIRNRGKLLETHSKVLSLLDSPSDNWDQFVSQASFLKKSC